MAMHSVPAHYLRAKPAPASGPLTAHDLSRFLSKHDIAPSRFGRDAVGDPCFVSSLRKGREVRPGTWARVHAFIAAKEGR